MDSYKYSVKFYVLSVRFQKKHKERVLPYRFNLKLNHLKLNTILQFFLPFPCGFDNKLEIVMGWFPSCKFFQLRAVGSE